MQLFSSSYAKSNTHPPVTYSPVFFVYQSEFSTKQANNNNNKKRIPFFEEKREIVIVSEKGRGITFRSTNKIQDLLQTRLVQTLLEFFLLQAVDFQICFSPSSTTS